MISLRNNEEVQIGLRRNAIFRRALRIFCGAVAIVAMPMMLTSCENDPNEVANSATAGMESLTADGINDIGVSISQLNDTPDAYVGKPIIVSGEINDIYTSGLFTIGASGWFGGELLVATSEPMPLLAGRDENEAILKGDLILVTGTLRKFIVGDIEQEFGFDVPPDLEVEFREKYLFVASGVDLTPRVDPAVAVATAPIKDILVVIARPVKPELIDRPVELSNVKVQSVVGDKAFWIGSSATERLFVLLDHTLEGTSPSTPVEGAVNVNPGQTVTLSGVLKKMPEMAMIQEQWELIKAESAPLKNEPVYLHANKVQVTSR